MIGVGVVVLGMLNVGMGIEIVALDGAGYGLTVEWKMIWIAVFHHMLMNSC